MEYILKYKPTFIGIVTIGLISLAVCVLSLRSAGEATLNTWQAIGSLVSVIIIGIGFFPLCYALWFVKEKNKALYYFHQTLYWSFTIAFIVIIIGISAIYIENT